MTPRIWLITTALLAAGAPILIGGAVYVAAIL
jgi:hypothetical protein